MGARRDQANKEPFDRLSLRRSWFRGPAPAGRADPLVPWEGQIVAEPAAGVYLAELADGSQHLVTLTDIMGWTFFDDPRDAP